MKKQKTQVWCFFLKKRVFLNPDYLSILFVIFPWSHDLEKSHVTIRFIGCEPHT